MIEDARKASPERTPKPARGARTDGPSRRNILGFGVVAAGTLGAAGYLLWPAVRQNLIGAPAGAVPVAISMSGFAPNVLTVKAGQRDEP